MQCAALSPPILRGRYHVSISVSCVFDVFIAGPNHKTGIFLVALIVSLAEIPTESHTNEPSVQSGTGTEPRGRQEMGLRHRGSCHGRQHSLSVAIHSDPIFIATLSDPHAEWFWRLGGDDDSHDDHNRRS